MCVERSFVLQVLPAFSRSMQLPGGNALEPHWPQRHLQWLLLAHLLVITTTTTVMVPFLPLYARSVGISSSRVGLIFGMQALSVALPSPLVGWLCGRVGTPSVLAASVLTIAGATAGLSLLPALTASAAGCFWALIGAAVVLGVGIAMGGNAIMTSLALHYPDAMGFLNGGVEVCYGVGAALGSLAGGVLYQAGGWWLPLACAAGVHALLGGLVWGLTAHTLRHMPCPHSPVSTSAAPERPQSRWTPLLSLRYTLPAAALLLAAIAFAGPAPVLPVHWAHFGLSVRDIGLMEAANGVVYSVCALGWGYLSDRTSPDLLIIGGLFLGGLTFPHVSSPSLRISGGAFVLMSAVNSAVWAASVPALLRAVRVGGPEVVGFTMGVNQLVISSGQMLGPVLTSWSQESYGLPRTFQALGTLMWVYAVGYMAYWLSQRMRRKGISVEEDRVGED